MNPSLVSASALYRAALLSTALMTWACTPTSNAPGDDEPPVDPGYPSSKATQVACGFGVTCALTTTGTVACWGHNSSGTLGNPKADQTSSPVAVEGLSSVTQLAVFDEHACALTSDGTVSCWGDNTYGQLGDGTRTQRGAPVKVPGLTGVKAIAAGGTFTCALTMSGGAQCWGDNSVHQLGAVTPDDRDNPGILQPSLVPLDVRGLGSGAVS